MIKQFEEKYTKYFKYNQQSHRFYHPKFSGIVYDNRIRVFHNNRYIDLDLLDEFQGIFKLFCKSKIIEIED